jgi:hypothetical protein
MKSILCILCKGISGILVVCLLAAMPYLAKAQEDSDDNDAKDELVYIRREYSINDVISEYEQSEKITDAQRSQLSLLAGEYEIEQFDVSEMRILLFLFSEDDKFVRMAVWDKVTQEYKIRDTERLPEESSLDTYHDGDCVLLWMSTWEIDAAYNMPMHELFLTFEYLSDDWYLTSFTDGNSFTADLYGQSYFFNDYYEPRTEYSWHAEPVLLFEDFSVFELLSYVDAYNNAMPDRLSLTEEK